jgi:hypothetical protein
VVYRGWPHFGCVASADRRRDQVSCERYAAEYRIVDPVTRKERRWLQARGRVERDERGTPLRLLGTSMDITTFRSTETDELLAVIASLVG